MTRSRKRDLTSASNSKHLDDLGKLDSLVTLQASLSSALATHLVLGDGSAENWRWFIDFLETQIQAIARKIVDVVEVY